VKVHDTNASFKRMLFSGNAITKITLREFCFFFMGMFSLQQETEGNLTGLVNHLELKLIIALFLLVNMFPEAEL
jgi:hypothetical protein